MPKPTVSEFLSSLEHPLKADVERVRALILGADPGIGEHIKWNAPSFTYGGEDRVTFNLRPTAYLQLVFHRGAKVKDATGFGFDDPAGLLEWASPDRAVLKLKGGEDVARNEAALVELVARWVKV